MIGGALLFIGCEHSINMQEYLRDGIVCVCVCVSVSVSVSVCAYLQKCICLR